MKLISRLFLGAMLIAAAGCMRWEHVPIRTAPADAPNVLGTLRVRRLDTGARMVLRDVEVRGDSVIGWTTDEVPSRVAVHRRQVILAERSRMDGWATVGTVVLAVLMVYGVVVAYVLATVQV